MSADILLSRLEKVKHTGPGRWLARCPAHDDRSPSLAIRELEDRRVLMHCFAGCAANDVLTSVGLTFSDLYPGHLSGHQQKGERRPFPAADVLRAINFECLVVVVAASSLARGKHLASDTRRRLMLAAGRIQAALKDSGHE